MLKCEVCGIARVPKAEYCTEVKHIRGIPDHTMHIRVVYCMDNKECITGIDDVMQIKWEKLVKEYEDI